MVAPSSTADKTVLVRIKRQDGPNGTARWEEFKVPFGEGANVISVLQWIAAHPKTTAGATTTPVAWDSGCLEEVCGACTMVINGKVRQSCSALIANIIQSDGSVTWSP